MKREVHKPLRYRKILRFRKLTSTRDGFTFLNKDFRDRVSEDVHTDQGPR